VGEGKGSALAKVRSITELQCCHLRIPSLARNSGLLAGEDVNLHWDCQFSHHNCITPAKYTNTYGSIVLLLRARSENIVFHILNIKNQGQDQVNSLQMRPLTFSILKS
jgi:hypothetical protein